MKTCHSLTLTAMLVFAAMLYSGAVQAVMMSFSTEVLSGPLSGETGTGTITYDHTLLSGAGSELIGPVGGTVATFADPTFALELMMFGQTFTTSDDVDFADYPVIGFFDGVWNELNFVVSEASLGPDNPTDIDLDGLLSFTMFDVTLVAGAPAFVEVFTLTSIPEPSTLALAGIALIGAARARRR